MTTVDLIIENLVCQSIQELLWVSTSKSESPVILHSRSQSKEQSRWRAKKKEIKKSMPADTLKVIRYLHWRDLSVDESDKRELLIQSASFALLKYLMFLMKKPCRFLSLSTLRLSSRRSSWNRRIPKLLLKYGCDILTQPRAQVLKILLRACRNLSKQVFVQQALLIFTRKTEAYPMTLSL